MAKTTEPNKTREDKDRLSGFLIVLLVFLLIFLAAVLGFLAYRLLFSGRGDSQYNESEYLAYRDNLPSQCPPVVPVDELANHYLVSGDPIRISGRVEQVGDNEIVLEQGVTCHIIPEALSDFDRSKLPEVLEGLQPGDEIRIGGMIRDTDPLTLKYCGLPRDMNGGILYNTPGLSDENAAPVGEDRGNAEAPENPGALSDLLYSVLTGEATFFNCGFPGYNYEPPNVLEYQTVHAATDIDGSGPYAAQSFAVADLDRDGANDELILRVADGNGNTRYVSLNEDTTNGIVIGHIFGSPADDTFFKTNGLHGAEYANGDANIESYGFGDNDAMGFSPGDEDYGFGGQSVIARREGDEYFNGFSGEDSVNQEQYEASLREAGWYETTDAVFYDYTDANIARFAP